MTETNGNQPNTETRKLPCVLTDADKVRLANQIGTLQEQLQPIEQEIMIIAANLKERKGEATGLKLQQYEIHRTLADGTEERDVECEVQLNTPAVGAKRVIRIDTRAIIEELPMDPSELQENLQFEPGKVHSLDKSGELTIKKNPEDATQ